MKCTDEVNQGKGPYSSLIHYSKSRPADEKKLGKKVLSCYQSVAVFCVSLSI